MYASFGLPGHDGVDLQAAYATPVRAVASGTVSKITTTGNYGNRIDVLHDGGWRTTYAHLDKFAGHVIGQAVVAGAIIGYAGSTGNSTGVHLHLSLKRDGYTYTDEKGQVWPFNLFDPTPLLAPFLPAAGIDLLPYLRGDGRLYEVKHPSGATETFQTQIDGETFFLVKNSQYEELYADSTYIWRGADTSPGGGRFYVQFEPGLKRARWMPRYMAVGQSWTGPGHAVQFYHKDTCAPSPLNSGNATNKMTFKAKHAAMTWNGITIADVVELTNGTETYFYAKFWGLVAWSSPWGNSAICETFAPGQRPDLTREQLNCSW